MQSSKKVSVPFLALALLALLAALWAGLLRLGWGLPPLVSGLALLHGPLMVSGFLGTLITLERVVALKQRWMYLAPLLTGVGWLVALLVPGLPLGALLLTLGSLGATVILGLIVRRDPRLHSIVMLAGALAWLAGNLLWLAGSAVFQVVYWWQAYLILTILGERLELNRVLRPGRLQSWSFGVIAASFFLGVAVVALGFRPAGLLIGGAMLALAVWSLPTDIAWRNLRHKLPLTRYIAWCLALGFVWLGIAGLLNMIYGTQPAGPLYDAIMHTLFIGFVISMIFGHAPIIFPALLGTPIGFHPFFYVQLGLLHLSLLLRVAADLAGWASGRMWGGMLNEIALLLFLGTTLWMVRRGFMQK